MPPYKPEGSDEARKKGAQKRAPSPRGFVPASNGLGLNTNTDRIYQPGDWSTKEGQKDAKRTPSPRFRPPSPGRQGYNATFNPWPKHLDERRPQSAEGEAVKRGPSPRYFKPARGGPSSQHTRALVSNPFVEINKSADDLAIGF